MKASLELPFPGSTETDMRAWRVGLAVLAVLVLVRAGQTAEPLPVLAAQGVVDKVSKDTLTIRTRGTDGKFGPNLALKITGTSKIGTLQPQMRAGKLVLTQRDTDARDLEPKQAIAVLYTTVKDSPVLLTAVVQPAAGK
jgi:hypothetical protein